MLMVKRRQLTLSNEMRLIFTHPYPQAVVELAYALPHLSFSQCHRKHDCHYQEPNFHLQGFL